MKLIIITLVLFSFSIILNGQDPSHQTEEDVRILTFQQAANMGLEKNVDLNKNTNQLAYTKVNKASTLLQLGPNVQATGDAYRIDGNSFNQNEGKVINGEIDYVNASIGASMPIFNGFNTFNTYKQASSLNEAQLHLVHRTRQDVIRQVAAQYLTCLLDQQLIKIGKENVSSQRVQLNKINQQVELGSVAEADLYTQEFQVKNAELTLLRAEIKLRNDKALLAQTIQLDPSIPFALQEFSWDANLAAYDSVSLDQMYATALDRRRDLKQASETEKAAHFGYSAAKGLYYPSLYAGANFGSRYNYIYGDDNRSFNDQFAVDNRQFSYGISLVIPIYGGLATRARAVQSRVQYENAKVQHESMELKIKSDVLTAYQNFRDAITSYESSNAQLRAAELSFQMEDERYNLGVSDIVQRNTANQAFIQAKGDFQSALYTLMFQRIMIDYAIGTLNSDVIDDY